MALCFDGEFHMQQHEEPNLAEAEADLAKARVDERHAVAELDKAEHNVEKAEAEVKEAKAHDHEVEVKVDGVTKRVKAGEYIVSVFKALVGVAADRELDIVKHGAFDPLDDNGKVNIHEDEVFVSHVRTGGSS